ncbi:MAG TPA: 2-dehydro-3-deoxy-6-phosphogalactonate aldolase [Casimicrobiaceae bacterium]|nr:2-dehydro-3-deoxy-6-phosphogalactonate aldolase [Casimicrobiaceae bacterium]
MNSISLPAYLVPLPLVAVLRGITPDAVDAIGAALADNGFRILEVPLNSPDPFAGIARLAQGFGTRCLVGAGTVLRVADVARVADAGGQLIVMPHGDVAIVREAKRRGLVCLPGVATTTEAFAALDAGADGLKMFPAEQLSPAVLKAWRAVLPPDTLVFPVGGIRPDNMAPYWAVGANGFGTGSNLYQPGAAPERVRAVAAQYAAAFAALQAGR